MGNIELKNLDDAMASMVDLYYSDDINSSLDNACLRAMAKIIGSIQEQKQKVLTDDRLTFELAVFELAVIEWEVFYFKNLSAKAIKPEYINLILRKRAAAVGKREVAKNKVDVFMHMCGFEFPEPSDDGLQTDGYRLDMSDFTVKRRQRIGFI